MSTIFYKTKPYHRTSVPAGRAGIRQGGSALIVSLIMLLLLSLIGVAAIQSTLLQDRMTGNLRDRELAFQAAEAALREAEAWLLSAQPDPADFNNAGGMYVVGNANRPDWPDTVADNGNGVFTYGDNGAAPAIDGVTEQPAYFVEQINTIVPPGTPLDEYVPPSYFRVTARAYGGSPETSVVIHTLYKNR